MTMAVPRAKRKSRQDKESDVPTRKPGSLVWVLAGGIAAGILSIGLIVFLVLQQGDPEAEPEPRDDKKVADGGKPKPPKPAPPEGRLWKVQADIRPAGKKPLAPKPIPLEAWAPDMSGILFAQPERSEGRRGGKRGRARRA